MGIFLISLAVVFGLTVWWALATSKPLKPPAIYRSEVQKCFDCHQPFTDPWFSVMKCDKCLLAYINRMDAGEIGIVAGALSVDDLEKMWALK